MIKSLTYQGAVFAGASALALLSSSVAGAQTAAGPQTIAVAQTAATAQTIDCTVLDEGGAGVPYANVYARDIDAGTVTEASGDFMLPVYAAPDDTPVQISCIGYADRATTLGALRAPGGCPVVLAPTDYTLAGAEVMATNIDYTRSRTYGARVRHSLGGADFIGSDDLEDSARGFEIGNHMKVKAPWALESIEMNLRKFETDAILLEFNVYKMDDGGPGERINQRRILYATQGGTDAIEVDVADYGIYGEGDFFVSMELLSHLGADDRLSFPVRLWRGLTHYKTPAGEWTPIKVAALSMTATVRSAE